MLTQDIRKNKTKPEARGPEGSSATDSYVAITHEQHPLTGETMPVIKHINRGTTVGELVDWYKTMPHGKGLIYDLRITEAT